MKHIFAGVIGDDRKLRIYKRATFDTACMTFKPGTEVTLTMAKKRKDRTPKANAYYWAEPIKRAADYFGYSPQEMHEEFKRLFNPVLSKIDQEIIGSSTADLSTEEFWEYVERIRAWLAMEYGIVVNDPKEVD